MSESRFPLMRKFIRRLRGVDDEKGGLSLWFLIFLFALAILFLSFGSCQTTKDEGNTPLSEESLALVAWRTQEEEKLEELLCRFSEIEECYVCINYSSGEENVRDGSVTVGFSPARVSSVVVLYEGTYNIDIKQKVIDLISTLYDIGANHVRVNCV